MKEYQKPVIEDEIIDVNDIVCVSLEGATKDGEKTDWSDVVNG